ncbi:hypothetical protein GCM10009039_32250 [Halocalculus aciditolerans]|uniref:Uncharacterized protein n=2 Tax=Halocalculus aciditolerans TaxID=1383812 RepID=A0A830FMY5_9EURY|nr:hypothetical protein GCM10009039_32250 [Halocalculus aciditolerans]
MIEMEPVTVIRWVTLLVVFVVFVFVAIAYYRTRFRRLLVLLLLDALLGLNVLATVGEDFFDNGVPYFGLLTSLLGLGIAILLLVTVVRRFD